MTDLKQEETTDKAGTRDIREVQVSEWWRSGAITSVVTTEGRSLRVLYPGRPTPHAGPDFRDTLLITEDGELVRGDTEVHLRRGDWDGHGHRGDPRYNGVVLHLYTRGGGRPPEPGSRIQEALLEERPGKGKGRRASKQGAAPLERMRSLPVADLERALDDAGERRFLGMTCAFTEVLRQGDAEQELYAGVMEALGYSQNILPMGMLARGLPLRRLQDVAGPDGDAAAVEAVLLGAAGLLERQLSLDPDLNAGRSRTPEMADVWRSSGAPAVVPVGMWSNAGLRPQNRPARRLRGAAALVARYRRTGLLEGIGDALQKGVTELERALVVEDWGPESPNAVGEQTESRPPALIGKSRAREIIVNVVLPLFFARGRLLGDAALASHCREMYDDMPPGQENEVTREMKSLLGTSGKGRVTVRSARRQQGLIHLYRVLNGQAK